MKTWRQVTTRIYPVKVWVLVLFFRQLSAVGRAILGHHYWKGNWWGKISRVVRWILETYENMKGGPARRVFLSSSYIFSYLYLWIHIWYFKISKWYYFQFFPGISIRIDTNRGVGVPFFWKSWNAGWYQYQHGWWCEFFKFLPKYAK